MANDGTNGQELWRTNGTSTTLVKDINPGASGSNAYHFTALGGYLYFRADTDTTGAELWRTDGTTGGTTIVLDILPGVNGSGPYDLVAFGGYVYFTAEDGSNGYEVWRTNGTTTTMFADIFSGAAASYPDGFTVLGNYLYFQANDGVVNDELWRTDGTTLGTTLVSDIRTGASGSDPEYFTPLGDYLYFSAYDGDEDHVYRTNGTVTEQVPFPISADQYIDCDCYDTNIATAGGRLFSTVYSNATGNEFAYLDEPTYVLPETNRDGGVGTTWTIALSALALVTLAAGVGLRRRAGAAQR